MNASGTAPSVHLASQPDAEFAGLILHSPMTTGSEIVCSAIRWTSGPFSLIDKIPSIKCRTLVIHGKEDRVWFYGTEHSVMD